MDISPAEGGAKCPIVHPRFEAVFGELQAGSAALVNHALWHWSGPDRTAVLDQVERHPVVRAPVRPDGFISGAGAHVVGDPESTMGIHPVLAGDDLIAIR
jgi:hypothetical protein